MICDFIEVDSAFEGMGVGNKLTLAAGEFEFENIETARSKVLKNIELDGQVIGRKEVTVIVGFTGNITTLNMTFKRYLKEKEKYYSSLPEESDENNQITFSAN